MGLTLHRTVLSCKKVLPVLHVRLECQNVLPPLFLRLKLFFCFKCVQGWIYFATIALLPLPQFLIVNSVGRTFNISATLNAPPHYLFP